MGLANLCVMNHAGGVSFTRVKKAYFPLKRGRTVGDKWANSGRQVGNPAQ